MTAAERAAKALTAAHAQQQAAIGADVKAQVLRLWGAVDPANVDAAWPLISRAVSQVIAQGYAVSTATAVAYLERHAAINGVDLTALTAGPLDATQLETALRVTGPVAVKTAAASGSTPAVAAQIAAVQIMGAAERLSLQGGRSAMRRTFDHADGIVGYRRVSGSARPCFFCAMLVGRGAVYKSKLEGEVASGRRGNQPQGSSFHDHCHCTAEPLYDHEDEPAEVAALYQRYRDAVDSDKYTGTPIQRWRKAYDDEVATVDTAPAVESILDRDLAELADDDLSALLTEATTDEEVDYVLAELDRRDEVARAAEKADADKARRKAARDAKREAEQAAKDAEFDRRVEAGDDPESAYADVFGVDVEQQRRNEAIAAMRSNGHTGRNFDELSRNAFRSYLEESYLNAENATRGALFRGKTVAHTQSEVDRLFNGPEAYARANASEELLAYWQTHGRLTLEDFRASMLGGQLKVKGVAAWY